jgi:hypothetical protein
MGVPLTLMLTKLFIVLIPNMANAVFVADYWPISLCNVIYKIIAKVLANWLKVVLPTIISTNQNAFVPGRLITDNILIAFEALHTMKSRMKGRKGYMAVKVDMRKAYDRVEWPFLEAMMHSIGFMEKLITLIMKCVKSVTYLVLVNGQPFGRIIHTRVSRFWWGHKNNQGRVHWMSWEKLGAPKNRGGMGFRDLEKFNMALLAKQGWRILINPNSLVARILKEKYFPREGFLEAKLGRCPSFVWSSMLKAKPLLPHGVGWRVGNGENFIIWGDAWLPPPQAQLFLPNQSSWSNDSRISKLIDPSSGWWNLEYLRSRRGGPNW